MANRLRWNTDGSLVYQYFSGTNTKTALTGANANLLNGDIYGTDYVNISSSKCVMINFPSSVSLSKVGIRHETGGTVTVKVSSNSTDGLDGTWTTVVNAQAFSSYTYGAYSFSPTACTWVRVSFSAGNNCTSVHLFGAYVTPRLRFYDLNGSIELTQELPLAFESGISNASDSNVFAEFKIKNTSGGTRSYSLSVVPARYGGDSLVTDAVKLSTDSGSTKLTTVTVDNVANDAMTSVIRLYMNLAAASNPADGYHQFAVDVTETA